MIASALVLALTPTVQDADHPLSKDRTGLEWVLPFERARQEARERRRLLLIKPVAFGTTTDGGR